jgi:hypothetical protein
MTATHEGEYWRADLASAFLHVLADKPFDTRHPSGHPDEYKHGVHRAMKWYILVYGQGNASRGLWHDFVATLISLGFEQQVSFDHCLFVHKTRNIDFGCTSTIVEQQLLMSSSWIGSRKGRLKSSSRVRCLLELYRN